MATSKTQSETSKKRTKTRNSKRASHRASSQNQAKIKRAEKALEHAEKQQLLEAEQEIAELLSNKFRGLNVFVVLMALMSAAIIWTGVQASMQIQQYRQDYKELQVMKQEYLQLQVEHKRLLIEQQTFSSTPQIATRAVSQLNMFFPSFKDKRILQPQASQKSTASPVVISPAMQSEPVQPKNLTNTNASQATEVSQ